jgi:hypothetical protein
MWRTEGTLALIWKPVMLTGMSEHGCNEDADEEEETSQADDGSMQNVED